MTRRPFPDEDEDKRRGRSRNTDPTTSEWAAEALDDNRARKAVQRIWAMGYRLRLDNGLAEVGYTAGEFRERLGDGIWKRVSEAHDTRFGGPFVYCIGTRRYAPTNRVQEIWCAYLPGQPREHLGVALPPIAPPPRTDQQGRLL